MSEKRPNIIMIMSDDLGYECIGVNGGTSYATPRLDEMAANGMRFDDGHVLPLVHADAGGVDDGQAQLQELHRVRVISAG